MNHNSKIWNAPRKVEVSYKCGWQCKRTKFKSLAECEGYLKEEIGDDTYIHLPDNEVEDAASAEVITTLCGNTKICAIVLIGDAAWKGEDTVADLAQKALSQAEAIRAMQREMEKWETRMRDHAVILDSNGGREARSAYNETVRCVKSNMRLFAKTFDKGR